MINLLRKIYQTDVWEQAAVFQTRNHRKCLLDFLPSIVISTFQHNSPFGSNWQSFDTSDASERQQLIFTNFHWILKFFAQRRFGKRDAIWFNWIPSILQQCLSRCDDSVAFLQIFYLLQQNIWYLFERYCNKMNYFIYFIFINFILFFWKVCSNRKVLWKPQELSPKLFFSLFEIFAL